MYEASDTMEGSPTYSKGDIVWVKLSSYWWPGEVINEEDLPGDLLSDFKKPPLVIVKFFDEDSYEYVRTWSNINAYNCPKKTEFVKKGMAGFRSKLSHMSKFPKDIGTAEERTNGNPNILSQPEFLPIKKVNYDEIFGTPSPKKSTKGPSNKKTPARDSNQPHITHRRFLGNDDYRAYICIQYPGKDRKWDSDDEEIKKLNEEPEKVLSCQSCSFKTRRLEVMILHTKMHIQGVYVTSKRKTKKSKGPGAGSDSESDSAVTKSPKPKQRKKKEVKPKTADVFSNLLEEWDDTDEDMEEPIAIKKPSKARKKTVQVEKLPLDKQKAENQNPQGKQDQENKSKLPKPASGTAKKTESSKLPTKNTQDDIKNCFDFDEEEEDDEFLMPTSAGRKIPRVIPEKPKPSISELMEQSQMEDELEKERTSDFVDDTKKVDATATENGTDVSKKEILKMSQSFNREPDIDDNIANTFKELMAETELPTLDNLAQNLKPEQNFHDARTVKFPDKGGTTAKGGATSKGGASKKKFVTSFEDFEAGFRKLEDDEERKKKMGGDKEVKTVQMPNVPLIDDCKAQATIKETDGIVESKSSEDIAEVPSEEVNKVATRTFDAELPSTKETALNELTETQSEVISSPSVEEKTIKRPDAVQSVGKRKTRQSEKEKPIETISDQETDMKEASQEVAVDSRRKSSRRRTKQFVIEEDSEEIIEITPESDSDNVVDSSEEVVLDQTTKETTEEINCQKEMVGESSTNDSVDSFTAVQSPKSENCDLPKEIFESTKKNEAVPELGLSDVPKKTQRRTRHSLGNENVEEVDEKVKELSEHALSIDETPIKGKRRASQRTHLKGELPSGSVEDLPLEPSLDISCAKTQDIPEKSDLTTASEQPIPKRRKGRSREHQKKVEGNLMGKELPESSHLDLDVNRTELKTLETVENPINFEQHDSTSNEKEQARLDDKEELVSDKAEVGSNLIKQQQEPIATKKGSELTEQENLEEPKESPEAVEEPTVPKPTPRTKRSKTRRHTQEFQQDKASPLKENTQTDKKLAEKVVDASDFNTFEAKLHPIESQTTVPDATNFSSLSEELGPPMPKTRRGRSQKHPKEQEVLATGLESTDAVPRIEVPEPKQDFTDIAGIDVGMHKEPAPKARRKRQRNSKEVEQHLETIEDHGSKNVESESKTDEQILADVSDMSSKSIPEITEEITTKTRKSRTRQDVKEREHNESALLEDGHKDLILGTEHAMLEVPKSKFVAVGEEHTATDLPGSTEEKVMLEAELTDATAREALDLAANDLNTDAELPKHDIELPVQSSRKGRGRTRTKNEQTLSAVEGDTVNKAESEPTEVQLKERVLEVNEEKIIADRSETAEQVDKTENNGSNSVPDNISDESNLTIRRGRSRNRIKDDEIMEPGSQEPVMNVTVSDSVGQPAKSHIDVLDTTVSDSMDKIIDHPTPKSRKSRSRKHSKKNEAEESTSLEKNTTEETQTKQLTENSDLPQTADVPLFSMPEEQFSKTRRGRSRKLTQEEEDFARAIEESLKDMAQERNRAEAALDGNNSETKDVCESKNSTADSGDVDTFVQSPDVSSRKSRKGKARKSLKIQEHTSTIQNEIASKDIVLEGNQADSCKDLVTDFSQTETALTDLAAPTVDSENTSIKEPDEHSMSMDETSNKGKRRVSRRTHLKGEPNELEELPSKSSLNIPNTEIEHILEKPISISVNPEEPTSKGRKGRSRGFQKSGKSETSVPKSSPLDVDRTDTTKLETQGKTIDFLKLDESTPNEESGVRLQHENLPTAWDHSSHELSEQISPSARKGRARKNSKEQQSLIALSEASKSIEVVPNQIEETTVESLVSKTAPTTSLNPTICAGDVEMSEPTYGLKKGSPRKHAVQEDTPVETIVEGTSKIATEKQSKELTAALEFTKTVLELVENQQVLTTNTVDETAIQKDPEQRDISMEITSPNNHVKICEEPVLKTRRGRSLEHTKNEEVVAKDISTTTRTTHGSNYLDVEHRVPEIEESRLGLEVSNVPVIEVVGQTSEVTHAEVAQSYSTKMSEGAPPKAKRGRPRKHVVENNSESIPTENKSLNFEPLSESASQAARLDDPSCVGTDSSGEDMGSMGSIIRNAIDSSVATLDSIPKSGLSEWVGELLKISSSKEEAKVDIFRKEKIAMDISNQSHEVSKLDAEVAVDELPTQENALIEIKSQSTSTENAATESTLPTTEHLTEPITITKRRTLKESLKEEPTPILETSQLSAGDMQEDIPTSAKSELTIEQVDEVQFEGSFKGIIPSQTDLISNEAEEDTLTSNKNDPKKIKIHDNKESERDPSLVTKNDEYSAKIRRGRSRKSFSDETLSTQEDPIGEAFSVLQSIDKIEKKQIPFLKEIKDAVQLDIVDNSGRHCLDELSRERTKIYDEVQSSIPNENKEKVPETIVHSSTVTGQLKKNTAPRYQETHTKALLQPTAVPEVVKPTILGPVHRKGFKTMISDNKVEISDKTLVSVSVKDSVPLTSRDSKSWSKRHVKEVDESSRVAFKKGLKQKFKDIVSAEASVREEDATKNNAERIPTITPSASVKNDETKGLFNEVITEKRHRKLSTEKDVPIETANQIKLMVKDDSKEQHSEEAVAQETPYSIRGKSRGYTNKESTSLITPDKTGPLNKITDQKTGLFEDKNRHVPPKKNKWSRRGSYAKSDNDRDDLLKEQIVNPVSDGVVSEEVVVEKIVDINKDAIANEKMANELKSVPDSDEEKSVSINTVSVETNHADNAPSILENSLTDSNDGEIILPPKKSKRASDVKYNFLSDSLASNPLSLAKKVDSDILSFPSCDDSFMSTSLRNNIEGLIKDIDSFDNSNVSDNLNITLKDDSEKVATLDIAKADTVKSEPADIQKCVPPKKKKIEYPKQDVPSSSVNSLILNDTSKHEEKLADVIPQPPKKKIQKLFESSQALEKIGKVSDIPQMSPLAKKKSFLFHPEEFSQKMAEISQQIDVTAIKEPETNPILHSTNLKIGEESITSLTSKEVEADANKSSTIPKKRQKRKSSSSGDHSQQKERRTSSETVGQEEKITFEIASEPVVDISIPSTPVDDKIKIEDEHTNKMEVKLEEDDFKFCIQTNLTNIATSTAEELSAIATATLSEIKNESVVESLSKIDLVMSEENQQTKQTVESVKDEAKEDPVVRKDDTVTPVIPGGMDVSSETEFVPISINPTVMSEKDLADAQVEITTDTVINEKKPTNLGMFSMDFLESTRPSKVSTVKIKKTELSLPKGNNTSGTEFTSKAMTKEFDNRPLITQPKAYALKSELLDILEGNSNSSTNSSGSDQKFKTSFDNYDKQTVVQGMFDFEEAIPSQIVLSNKIDPETVLMDSPKLLERLSMSNDAAKAMSKKVLIQSDVKVPEGVPKTLIAKMTKPMGTPRPGQKILIKTTKAQPIAMSKATGNKPIILSEQIIRPANAPKPAKPVIQPQGIKRQYEDIEDVETAFIIQKIAKKSVEEEDIPEVVAEKPPRVRGSKTCGKAKILQQTIITPKGEIVQSQTPTTTQSATPALLQTTQPDDAVFDINSMPIVLSDDLLTPESIQNMPVVLSEDVLPQSKPVPVKAEEKVVPMLAKKTVANVTSKQQIIFKTTLSGPTAQIQAKQTTKPRILSNTLASTNKIPKPTTALLATGTSADGKPTKYVLVPSTVTPTVPQVKSVKPTVVKKQLSVPSKVSNVPSGEPQSPVVGNKIMIVTNQHGQQTRVVLTPQQQKAFMQAQPGSKTKAIIKGAIPKALLESASAGPSGIVQKAVSPSVPQGVVSTVSSQGGLLMTVGKGAKVPVQPKKIAHKPPTKPQKTILIKNQMGQTVRKIQGTDDADLDRQVAEQLEAIKASARLQQANKSPEIINYTNRHIASSTSANKVAARRSYSKKVDPVKVKPTVSTSFVQKPQEPLIPALAPLSPQPMIPQVQSQTSPNIQKQSATKLDPLPSSPVNKSADARVQQQSTVSVKPESKHTAATPVGAEKSTDRPLTQLVIQDGLGNQTTITEGQILAIPSETVDGQPQSYMLVTLDEMGNITPLNNEALMSLDPSLGLGGDLNNMVLQVDQGQGTVAALKPAEPSVPLISTEDNKIVERLHAQPPPEPKPVPLEQPKPQQVPLAIEQQIVIGEGVLPGADAGGQQLIVTGDPIATQKFFESLSDGSTDLANILANAEGGSVLIQADGQQILIKTNTSGQPLLGISENTEGGGNPIFGTHKPNQDILAAALANTDVFPSSDQQAVHQSPVKGMQSSQLSPSGGSGVLYPMHVGNVLETSLTLSSPIMTPLEVPSIPNKKIDDDVDILNQVPKNVDLPITITDPNISQTAQQAIGLMELTLPISETTVSGGINSPSYSYSLPSLDEAVGHAQKPFNGSMPLLTEDVTEMESSSSSQIGKIRVAKGLQCSESSFSSSYGSLPLLPETIESSREEVVKTSCFGEIGSLPLLTDDVIDDSGSSRGSSKPHRSSPKNLERDIVDEGLSTLGGEMCSSLSEPPPDMFDLASITAKEEEISSDMSSIPEPEGETLSLHSENSGEIPIQPLIVANLNDLKRAGDDTIGQDEKRQKFD